MPDGRPKAYLDKYDTPVKPLTEISYGKRGELNVEVSNPSVIKVGEVLKIQWYNREGEAGSLLRELYGDPLKFKKLGSHHWNYPHRPLASQKTRIKAVEGNTVTLSDPLILDANPSWNPEFVTWEHLENISISDLHIEFPNGIFVAHHVEDGFNALYLTGLYDSFVRNVTITNADSGAITDDDGNLTFEDITTRGEHRAHYSVHMGDVYNSVVRRLRIENTVVHPLSFNTYSVKSVYTECEVLQAPVLDQHSGANHQNLFDNIKVHLQIEEGKDSYPLFVGGGAGYWKPTHGRYSSFYNIDVRVEGAAAGAGLVLKGPADGPGARLIGIHGNRNLTIEYGPDAYLEQINEIPSVPSLLNWQLERRLGK